MTQDIDWSEFKPDAPGSPVAATPETDWSQFQPAPKSEGIIRKLADVALEVPAGAAHAIKAGVDAFGAGGEVAESLGNTAQMYQDMQSPARQFERQAQAQRSQTAEATGSSWEEVKTAGQNFLESPISAMANAAGSIVPIAAGVMAAAPLGVPALATGATLGLGMGLGAVKGSIYDDLVTRGKAAGLTPEEATAQADAAQAYFGPNMDQVGVGGVLGILAGTTGIERVLGGATSGIRNLAKRTLLGMGQEAVPEAAQGGQEKLAANIAAQRAGYDASTWGGVAGQATAEGLASTGPGGVGGAMTRFVDPTIGPISAAARVAQEAQISGALPAPGQLSGDASIQLGAEGSSRDPSAEYEAQQRNTELQAARAAQEQQRAAVDPAYPSQLDGSALPTAAQQTADFQASPSAQVAGALPAPGQLSGEASIQLPAVEPGGDPNTTLAAQQRNTELQASRAAEEQRRTALDPAYASQLDGTAPPAPVDPAARQREAIEDVVFANGDDPANVRIYTAQDLPDAPTGSERGAVLSRAQASVVEGLGRVFGTEYRFYDSPNAAKRGDGFVRRGVRDGVAYIRATEGDAAPLVVAGHETYHGLTTAERTQFSNAIAQHVDVSDKVQLEFLTSYTAGRYQAKVEQLVKAGVAETEIMDAILAQAAQDGHADLTRAKLREEFDADIFGNRMGDTKFWKKTFELLKQEDRALVLKISAAIKKAIAFLKGQKLRGYDTDRYVKDLEAVREIAARTLLTSAKRSPKSESGSLSDGTVVRSAARVGPFRSRSTAELTAKMRGGQVVQAGEEFFVEQDDGQAGRLDQGRGDRAAGDAGASRQSDQRDAEQRTTARRDQPQARPSGATADLESQVRRSAEGAVSLTAVHFSREPRQVLDGRFYGTGLKGAEARRLEGEPDRRLHERVYAYVNEGAGVTAESGVGSYPHALELSNLYDLAKDLLGLRIAHRGDANALEKAILDQGFAGYYAKGAFPALKQGAAVVMGDASHAVVPKGEVVRSASRTLEKENQVAVTVGGKPGEFGWSPAAKMAAELALQDNLPVSMLPTTPKKGSKADKPNEPGATDKQLVVNAAKLEGTAVPPFIGPTQYRPNLVVVGEAVRKVLSAKAARDVLTAVTGAKITGVAQIAGSWEGKPEPSFVLSGDMTYEQANEVSKVLGFLIAQDATVVAQPWVEPTKGERQALLISQSKVLTEAQIKALGEASRAAGLDYSTTVDGRGAKFLHFGDEAGFDELGAQVAEIAKAAGIKDVTAFFVRSELNGSETYLSGEGGRNLRQARDQDGGTGPSDLFRRAIDSILVPYAKAVGAEGYRFSPDRLGERFGLTDGEVEYIRAALRPKSGKALSTVPIATGAETLATPRTNTRTKIPGVSKNDLLWALQNRTAQHGFIEPGDYSPEASKVLAESMAEEVIHALNTAGGKSAVGWYDRALHEAKTHYEKVFPELRSDPDREMLFDAVLGITSQGNDVGSNAVFAGRVYYLVTQEGMTLSQATETLYGTFGKETRAIENNILKLEDLLDRNGYPAMRKLFNTKDTVSAINAALRKNKDWYDRNGEPLKVEGQAEQVVNGWMMFGPKIGSFINNLHGDYSTLTADLWFSRTWNRALGFVFRQNSEMEASQYITLYRAMLDEVRTGNGRDLGGKTAYDVELLAGDPESLIAFAEEVHTKREYEYASLRGAAVTPVRQAAKQIVIGRQDSIAAPRGDRERAFQQYSVELAQKMVKRRTGTDITVADIQAVLWYHEKDLFQKFGVGDKKAEKADYADAARKFVTRYQDGELFYVEKPKPRYIHGEKGDYLKDGGVVRSARRAQADSLARAFISVSQMEGAFQTPVSSAKDLASIVSVAVPTASVRDVTAMYSPPAKRQMYRIGLGGSDSFVTYAPDTNSVWLNVAAQGEGKGGSQIYAAVGNWAANNGYSFVGDPEGLSETGKRRRLENVISLKLKFPQLDVRLHPSQLEWLGDKFGITLELSESNSLHNLGEFIRASYEVNRQSHPDIEHAEFTADGSFLDRRTGRAFDFAGLASKSREFGADGSLGAAGAATLRRAALAKSVVEEGAAGRDGDVLAALYALRDQSASAPAGLSKVLYSARRSDLGFYSQLSRAVEGAKFETQPAGQWKLWLAANAGKLGVKADQIEWSGVTEWLDLQDARKVTKAELAAFLEQGGVQIKEVTLTESGADPDSLGRFLVDRDLATSEEIETMDFEEALELAVDHGFAAKATKYDKFTEPGGTNYREVLLTLPQLDPNGIKPRLAQIADEMATAEGPAYEALYKERARLADDYRRKFETKSYKSSHWAERNVLAHLRVSDRAGPNGEKVLFIQELQSDWGQDGKKKGFAPRVPETPLTDGEYSHALDLQDDSLRGTITPAGQAELDVLLARHARAIPRGGLVHPGPFVTDTKAWVALAVKRAIVMAAEGGYDQVALVTGEQSADLYDLSKQVTEVAYNKSTELLRVLDTNGREVFNDYKTPAELPDVIGKELADKILQFEGNFIQIEGLDLKVGGEGMVAFYDRIVPQVVNDVLKKAGGGKLGPIEIVGMYSDSIEQGTYGDGSAYVEVDGKQQDFDTAAEGDAYVAQLKAPKTQPGFTITPEMRERVVTEGLPLFSARRAYADITPAQDAALRAVGLIREPKTVKQRFAELTDNLAKRLTQGIVDQYAPLKELDFRAYVLSRMSKGSDGTMEAAMYYGTPQIDGDTVKVDTSTGGFMAMLSKLDGEQDRFLSWIAANRAEQLTAEGKEFLFTPDQIRELKNLNQGVMPDGSPRAVKYAQVLREFNGFQDSVLAIAEARGLIDAESRQVWKDGFYVPFYRNMEDGTTGPSVKSGLVNQYAFKKLKGSRRQLNEDLLANTLQNMAHLLSASAKNHAARAALVAAQSAGVAHRVPSGTKGAVRFLEAGRERHYLIDDPFIFDAISSLESVQVVGVEKILSKFKHWLTMGVTINPVFQLRSLMRDMIAAMAVSDIEKNPFANVASGIRSQLVKDQDYINALASGGLIRFNSLMEGNRADHTRKLIKMGVADSSILDTTEKVNHFLTKTLDKYLAIGDISESTNRMALYKQLIAKGVDPLLAAYQSRDLMDFSMQGQWRAVRFLTQVVPFLNARLQGLYKLGRDGVVPTGRVLFGGGNATDKQIAKRFSAVTGAVALASILLLEAFGDDEDWKKREDWDRDTYWWFKVGGHAFRIPKPFEVGAIGTVAERGWEYMTTDDLTGARLGARMGHMLASTFALNPTPQAVKPLLDVYANEESFTKKPIESMGMERLKPEDRFTGRTSETAKWLGSMGLPDPVRLLTGEVRPLSPVQIDSLIRGYFSWLGVSATRIVDESVRAVADRPARPEMQLRDVFFAGNFAETLPANTSRYVTALYDQAKEIEFAYASYRYALRTGNTERAQELMAEEGNKIRLQPVVNAAKNAMAKFNENIRIIERDKVMSAAEKRERIDRLKMLQHQVAMRVGPRLMVD